MRILLSNDDGIHAPGLAALYEAVRPLGEIHVVAPLTQQSAVGHAITIANPIRVEKIYKQDQFFGYGVTGTPADAVKLAVDVLCDPLPDLLISGINLGPNVGVSILYSGTVSAATEGTILNIPSIAISLNTFENPQWETAAGLVLPLVAQFTARPLPVNVLLNVNVPNVPPEQLKGIKPAIMSDSYYDDVFHERADPRGRPYFWMAGNHKTQGGDPRNDLELLKQGYVTLTPIGYDLTRHDAMAHLETWTF